MKTLRIINPVPSFICPYRRIECGPYDVGEIIVLPSRVADLLIRKKRAKEIIVENNFSKWEAKND